MQPIKVTYENMVGTWLVLSAIAYAIPSDIMSYEWANSFVDTTAHLIPAIDKLKQAYAQNLVTDNSLFFHTCLWPFLILILLLMIKPTFEFVGKELTWLQEGAKFRLIVALIGCSGALWLKFTGSYIEDVLDGGYVDKLFRLEYEIELGMAFSMWIFATSLIIVKHILIHLFLRRK